MATLGRSALDKAIQPEPADDLRVYLFGDFRLDPANHLLTCAGREVALPGRAFDALLLLVRRPGALVTKEELMSSIWKTAFVEESNLTVAISTLRRALNEDPHDRRYIQTVSRRGYRFIAEMHEEAAVETAIDSESIYITDNAETATETVPVPAPVTITTSAEMAKPMSRVALPARAAVWSLTLLIVLLLAALAAGGWWLLKPRRIIRTLAVLPFTATGGALDSAPSEIVLLGMTDGMVSLLEGSLIVRPASSVLRYSESGPVNPMVAGREQEVDAVLTGEFDGTAARRSLKLRLIRVADGLTLWQDSFQADPYDLPHLEQEAGNAAARELQHLGASAGQSHAAQASATAGKQALTRANEPAYQLYLRGRYFWNRRTVDGLRKSTDYFRQSIGANPNYALAYAGLADSYALLASFSVEPGRTANVDARSAALSAIHLDPALAEPHASLGMIYFFTDWNLTAAETEFGRAIALNPNYATAHHWYALDLAAMGRFPQALYEIRLAQKLDPLSLIIGTNVGWIEYLAHDNAAADRDLHRVLELDPNFVRARTRLGMVEMAEGQNTVAVVDLTQALALSGDEDPWVEGLLGEAEARAGNHAAAERTLANVSRRSGSQYVPPTSRALVLIGLGRRAEAIAALGQAIEDHSTSMVYARVDPSFDPLRSDPEFQALLARL